MRKLRNCIVILMLFISLKTFSQAFPPSMLSFPGKEITLYGMLEVDNSYYIFGIEGNESSGGDAVIVKYSLQGDVIWQKAYAGATNILVRSACVNEAGGLTLAGNTTSGTNQSVVVLKTDALGNPVWSQTYGKNYNERGFRIIMLSDGGYMVCGSTQRSVTLLEDAFIMRISSTGQLLWSRILGGPDRDNAFDVSLSVDNNLLFTGAQSSFGAGVYDYGFGKMDMNGNLLYYKTLGGGGQDHSRIIRQVDDGYYILGHSNTYSGSKYDILLIRTSINGSVLWSKRIFSDEELYTGDITFLEDGLIISGSTMQNGDRDLFVLKTDFNGNPQWGKIIRMNEFQEFPFGGSGVVIQTSAGRYTGIARSQSGSVSKALLISFAPQLNSGCFELAFMPQSENISITSVDHTAVVSASSGFTQGNLTFLTSDIELQSDTLCLHVVSAGFIADKQEICQGDSIRFTNLSYDQPLQYFWSFEGGNPATSTLKDPVVGYQNPGNFGVSLRVVNSHGDDELVMQDYIRVNRLPSLSLGPDTALCRLTDLQFSVSGFNSYLWHDGSTGNQPLNVVSGWNFVDAISPDGCLAHDSVYVSLLVLPELSLGPDTSFCDTDVILLTASGFDAYQWHDGSTGNQLLTSKPGWNYVKAYTSEGCMVSDSLFIRYCCNLSLKLPNVFSPDDDGINDHFKPIISEVPNYSMVIANRWGAVLYSTNDINESWDGTFKGKKCPQGVYYVSVQFDGCNDLGQFTPRILYGSVTLLRKL